MLKPPQHVKLKHLIPIAAELATVLHLGSEDLDLNEHSVRRTVRGQARGLQRHTGDLLAAFGKLKRQVDLEVEGSELSAGFLSAINALKAGLTERSCDYCAMAQRRCERDQPTNERVHLGGNCIRPIKALFEDVEGEAGRLWARTVPGAPLPSLRLATNMLRHFDKKATHVRFSVTGKAEIVEHPTPMTTIAIAFYDSPLDWEQFAILPYLLFHEIVCHGYSDIFDPSGAAVARSARFPADPDCVWAEGWMDTVSHRVAGAWIKQNGARHHIASEFRLRKAERWTGDFHDARYGANGTVLSKERHFGRQAFDRVKQSITTADFSMAEALDLMLRFSVLLNAVVFRNLPPGVTPNQRRSKIVERLDIIAVGVQPAMGRALMERFLEQRDVDLLA